MDTGWRRNKYGGLFNINETYQKKEYKKYNSEEEFLDDNDNMDLLDQCLNATKSMDEAYDMKDAISEYTDENYRNNYLLINGRLNREEILADDTKRNVDLIQKAISANPLKKDMMVYRAVDLKDFDNIRIGSEIYNKGFTSTSLTEYVAKKFEYGKYEPAMIEIQVPAGTKGVYIGADTFSQMNEKEILFGLNTKITIIEVNGNRLKGVIK